MPLYKDNAGHGKYISNNKHFYSVLLTLIKMLLNDFGFLPRSSGDRIYLTSLELKTSKEYKPLVLNTSGNKAQWSFRDRKQIM